MAPKKLAAYVLGISAGFLVYLGLSHNEVSTLVCGIGFTAVAWVFWKESQED